MPARTPEEVHRLFVDAFNAGDLDALVALYESGASLVPQPGEAPVSGVPAIRQALGGLLAMKGTMTLRPKRVVLAGDVALLLSAWSLTARGGDGRAVELKGQTSDVVRLHPDGAWRVAIDNPWGSDA